MSIDPSASRPSTPPAGAEKKMLAGLLGILLGWTGAHKFVLGYQKEGIIQLVVSLVTCGVFGIVGLIEGIIYLTKSEDQFYRDYVINRNQWF